MKKIILTLGLILGTGIVYADSNLQSLTADTTAQSGDLIYKANTPGWTSRAITVGNLISQIQSFGHVRYSYAIAIGTNAAVGNDLTNWNIIGTTGTFNRVDVAAKTAPVGASLIFDIQKSTNNGSTFTSLWNSTPANKPILTTGSKTGFTKSFDTTTANTGDLLRIDVDQVGSSTPGSNITVSITFNPSN